MQYHITEFSMHSSHTLVDQDQLIHLEISSRIFLQCFPAEFMLRSKLPYTVRSLLLKQFTQVYKGNACNLDFGLAEVSQHSEAVVYIYTLDYTLAGALSDREWKIDL